MLKCYYFSDCKDELECTSQCRYDGRIENACICDHSSGRISQGILVFIYIFIYMKFKSQWKEKMVIFCLLSHTSFYLS